MEALQAVVESQETQAVVEQPSEQAAAEIVRNLSAVEMCAVGGGSFTGAWF